MFPFDRAFGMIGNETTTHSPRFAGEPPSSSRTPRTPQLTRTFVERNNTWLLRRQVHMTPHSGHEQFSGRAA